jgi:hypothetical protein
MFKAMVVVPFTPVESLLGGLALGVAAGAMVLVNGRITGLSGIVRCAKACDGNILLF